MRKYLNVKLVFAVAAALVFSGCAFSNAAKKTEIDLKGSQSAQPSPEAEKNTENNATDTAQSQADEPKKTEAPADTNISEETAKSTAPPESASKTTATSTADVPVDIPKFKINNRLVSWGFTKSSSRKIDTIIIHSSYNAVGSDPYDLDDIINKEYKPNGVSPHYIIGRDGKVSRLVSDQNIAYHAGVSEMPDGRTNVNGFSIGIEVVETKTDSPNSAQYSALKSLISYLKGEYDIKYVLGHSDIAPDRKDDPWNFSWSKIGGKEK